VYRRVGRKVIAVYAVIHATFALGSCALADAATTHRVSAADAKAIDALFAPYAGRDVPGAAVLVMHGGRIAFSRGYGLADLETRRPVTDRTNFRLASLTKAFTAVAILRLVEDGALRLDDHVADILPDFPAYGRAIRIRHLLSHTSGLQAYQEFIPASQSRPLTDRDVLTLIRRTDSLLFPPGTAFRYGDSGYAILALVVEAVSRQPFARFLDKQVFARAGMKSTLAWEPGRREVPNRAVGYVAAPNGFRVSDHNLTSAVLGDGGVYSSVRDLAAWDRALDAHRLISASLQHLAWAPTTLSNGAPTRYGFGWYLERDGAEPYVFHRGETSGFSNFIVKYPHRRLTVAVLTNRHGGAPDDIATAITRLASFRRTTP
jgi:CubicO group peptidase (beta-lactamase class C family)